MDQVMTVIFHCVCVCARTGRHPEEDQLLIRPSGREKTVYTLKQTSTELTTGHTSLLKWK